MLYIAGLMRGKHLRNYPLFNAVSKFVSELGHSPLNPAARADIELGITADGGEPSEEQIQKAMALDFRDVLDSDGIVLLPGWQVSVGACAEELVARLTGKLRFEYQVKYDPLLEVTAHGLEPLR